MSASVVSARHPASPYPRAHNLPSSNDDDDDDLLGFASVPDDFADAYDDSSNNNTNNIFDNAVEYDGNGVIDFVQASGTSPQRAPAGDI